MIQNSIVVMYILLIIMRNNNGIFHSLKFKISFFNKQQHFFKHATVDDN